MYKNIIKLMDPYRGLPKEIYIIFLSKIVNAIGCFVMPLLTIILTEKIGLSKEMTGMYISVAGFIYMPAAMFGGKLTDCIGRKKIILIFDTLAAILYIICGLMTPSITMVYVLFSAVVCMVIAGPAHDSLVADLTTPENRANAYALCYMGWNIGFAIGPILGGLLYKNHLSLVFIGDAFTALLSLVLIFFFIKETIGLTKEEITEENRVLEKREEGSILAVLLKRPILLAVSVILFGYNFAYSQWSFMMPMHVMEIFKDGTLFTVLASINGLVVMILTPVITKLGEKKKEIKMMVYGGLFYAVGFGMLGFLNTLPFFIISVVIFTIGEIILSISVTPFIVNHTPMSHRGRMNAVLPIIFGMGYTLGPMGMGKVLMHTSIETGWLLVGGITITATIFMSILEKYDGRKKTEEIEALQGIEVTTAEEKIRIV